MTWMPTDGRAIDRSAKRLALGLAALGLAALAPLASRAQAAGDRLFSVDPARSSLTYGVVHTLHKVDATSRKLEGKALFKADGTVQVMVRAQVAGFDSGDHNRDEHMLEVMEASLYPTVTFKGVARIAPPARYPAAVDVPVAGELELHGKKFPETIPVHVELRSQGDWRVTSQFDVSLDKYGIERPALLLKKIDDACHMTIDLSLAGQ